MAHPRSYEVPNDQWEDVKTYPKGDIRTLRKILQGMLDDARVEARTGNVQGSLAAFAGGKVEAMEEAMAALATFIQNG